MRVGYLNPSNTFLLCCGADGSLCHNGNSPGGNSTLNGRVAVKLSALHSYITAARYNLAAVIRQQAQGLLERAGDDGSGKERGEIFQVHDNKYVC